MPSRMQTVPYRMVNSHCGVVVIGVVGALTGGEWAAVGFGWSGGVEGVRRRGVLWWRWWLEVRWLGAGIRGVSGKAEDLDSTGGADCG